ncbi:DUF1993 family protein [Pseudoduganella sp. RAF19]|uniref:DUF1993 domain-containing protein n=2 Tax=unclassified Pseudoduganella TaxID=2637179 RepID=UPI003F9DAA7A
MSVSMYRVSAPVFVRGLKVAAELLRKAEAHVEEHGIVPDALLSARLVDDMLPLSAQVQRASDTSKGSVERLSGVTAPKFPDDEATFAQLQERIAKTIAYIESVPQSAYDGSETREISLNFGSFKPTFNGENYLLDFGLPNFYFHLTTLHDILRNQGVKVGKMDFLGPYDL